MMQSTIVAIGRNIGSRPMPERRWTAFRRETRAAVQAHCGTVYSDAEGVGFYEGMRENTAVFVAGAPRSPVALEAELAYLAQAYGQESIAVTYGDTRFVEGIEAQ